MQKQTTNHILMVRPSYFGFNHETAANNTFQNNDNASHEQIRQSARNEYDSLVALLKKNGINIISYSENPNSQLTDSIFPNNWFSTHYEGHLVTYPMFSEVRREERDSGVLDLIESMFIINKHTRLERYEKEMYFLEGTGSMILDRENKRAYACRSKRTHEVTLDKFCEEFNYEKILFDAVDESGYPIYHTNVMMSLGENIAVICDESISDEVQKERVFEILKSDEKHLIDITLDQVKSFAGNILEVKGMNNQSMMVMSDKAYEAFLPQQIKIIEQFCSVIHSPIPTIEKYGGGGVRCMMAEIFLKESP